MGAESRLLYDERPLVLIPELARLLKKEPGFSGIDEALILQQVHYWVKLNQRANKNEKDGYFWTYNTFKAWAEQFSFLWSESTLKRIFARLEKGGFLISGRFNKSNIDRTKWYRIDYDAVNRLYQSDPSIVSTCDIPSGQPDTMDSVNLTLTGQARTTNEISPPESNQRLTTENNNREKGRHAPRLASRSIFAAMQSFLGFPDKLGKDPIPNYGKEAKAIDRMLQRGYTEDEILAAWKLKVSERGEFVTMVWVNEDIGKPDRNRPKQAAFNLPNEERLATAAKERGLIQ